MPQNENVNFKIDHFDNLGRPFRSGNNEYSIFESIENRYGVYIFEDNNGILYIGESHDQNLKARIIQNYQNGTGATFRNNWCRKEGCGNGKTICSEFENALKGQWKITTMSIDSSERADWIHALEAVLIVLLQPKYNK